MKFTVVNTIYLIDLCRRKILYEKMGYFFVEPDYATAFRKHFGVIGIPFFIKSVIRANGNLPVKCDNVSLSEPDGVYVYTLDYNNKPIGFPRYYFVEFLENFLHKYIDKAISNFKEINL